VAFKAVLDASVLFPFTLRDALLRSAEIVLDDAGDEILTLYTPLWSELILDEMSRNIVKADHATQQQMTHLVNEMTSAFPEAMVPLAEIKALESSMTNDPKDRHVLAAAVAADAEVVVTFNLKHFPPETCEAVGVEAIDPDRFLCDLHDLAPHEIREAIEAQAGALTKGRKTFDELLDNHLIKLVPAFVDRLRS
jgi:predicted nucleic acid-binding protein